MASRQAVAVVDRAGRRVASARRSGPGMDTPCVHPGPAIFDLHVDARDSRWSLSVQEKTLPAERIAPP